MRLAPVAIYAAPSASYAAELAAAQSRTTHAAPAAHDACALFAMLLVEAIMGASKADVLKPRSFEGRSEIADIAAEEWRSKTRDQISSSGFVVDTLEAALWCISRSGSFEEAVVLAANLGDDADTVAAVTGQLAGALWGRSGIPLTWRTKIAWGEKLEITAMQIIDVRRRPVTAALRILEDTRLGDRSGSASGGVPRHKLADTFGGGSRAVA